MTSKDKENILKSIAQDYNGDNIIGLLYRSFEVGRDFGFEEAQKHKSKSGLNKIPDWILVRNLTKQVEELQTQLKVKSRELEESLIINGDKLHKASIEIQREKMYNTQAKELASWRRKAHELSRAIGSLQTEINRLKGIV